MNSKGQAHFRRSGEIPIIDISGDLSDDLETDLVAAYQVACQPFSANIIINFENVEIYSSGLSLLVGLVGEAEEKGQKFHAVGLSKHFVEVFQLTGLTRYIQIHESEQEVLECLR